MSSSGQDNTVSWSQVAGSQTFVAKATANDGHNYTCISNSSNSCNLTDLHCGENYTVTVVTVDGGCWSEPSAAVVLKTGNRNLETKGILIFTFINHRNNLCFFQTNPFCYPSFLSGHQSDGPAELRYQHTHPNVGPKSITGNHLYFTN